MRRPYAKLRHAKNKLRSLTLRWPITSGPGYFFTLDSPNQEYVNRNTALVSGWFIPNMRTGKLRLVLPNGKYKRVRPTIPRKDVTASLARDGFKVPEVSGFSLELREFLDGIYKLQATNYQGEWTDVCEFTLRYDRNYSPSGAKQPLKVKTSASRYTAHLELLAAKKLYYYRPASSQTLSLSEGDPKLIAFYLPQFHTIPENDAWWGKGFTEWQNVGAAMPRFVGHEQPQIPADLGYYNLLDIKTHRAQAELAKQHGLYGFCYYYYWFSGKRLLEQPLDLILKDKKFDFNFMICWANENWTRRWDGLNKDILIKQENKKSDPLAFIKDVEHILTDKRYIRIDGKPALMVYRAEDLGDPKQYTDIWRDYFRKKHNLELHLIAVRSFSLADDVQSLGFDKGLEFAPLSLNKPGGNLLTKYPFEDRLLDERYEGWVYDYRKLVCEITKSQALTNNYLTVMPSWDNDSRRKGRAGSTVFYGANPDLYGYWLERTIAMTRGGDTDITFINAWNEWAEGTVLEPTLQYGHAYLQKTAEVVAGFSNNKKLSFSHIERTQEAKTAVVAYVSAADEWAVIEDVLSVLDTQTYDLFVGVTANSMIDTTSIASFHDRASVINLPHYGGAVAMLAYYLPKIVKAGYDNVLYLNQKNNDKEKLRSVLPTDSATREAIFELLENPTTGIIGDKSALETIADDKAEWYVNILDNVTNNQRKTDAFLQSKERQFFKDGPFWARVSSVAAIADCMYGISDFDADGDFSKAFMQALSSLQDIEDRTLYGIDKAHRIQQANTPKKRRHMKK